MNLDSNQKELIELFVEQELLISKLYTLFSKRYLDYVDFWVGMSREEYHHATLVKRIVESDSRNEINLSQGELRSNNLSSSLKFIQGIIDEFKSNKNFPIGQAVIMALHIEKGLWERKMFQSFEGDSSEVRRIMENLNLEQELHIKKLDRFASQFHNKNIEKH
jgi:hypothetical protein